MRDASELALDDAEVGDAGELAPDDAGVEDAGELVPGDGGDGLVDGEETPLADSADALTPDEVLLLGRTVDAGVGGFEMDDAGSGCVAGVKRPDWCERWTLGAVER